ncbi:receptor like protein 30 isoform X1 [Capsella rubella]|nr:receptor like protein 30 isoform X1 [Capsella rubella]
MSFLLRSISFLFFVSCLLNRFVSSTQHLCHLDERDALLEFKTGFLIKKPLLDVDSGIKTESWVIKSDCCSWDGITCAAKSGRVIGLDLSFNYLYGKLESNSSLFKLLHLRDLNLTGNNFNGSSIPAQFDKLMKLETLDLSDSSLSGQIPVNLLQLTKLVSLHLSSSFYPDSSSSLSIDESFLHLLAQNLRSLRELDMSNVNISSKIPHEFSKMRSLRSLDLSYCNLCGKFPSSVLLIPSLQSIRLINNPNLRGNLPSFRENNSLLHLTIKLTAFSGPIPDSISSLKHLISLTLSFSHFTGKIPFSLGNLSHLSILNLGWNFNLVGEIPSSIGNLKQLTIFYVSGNTLSGNLPASILNFTQLRELWLSPNQFTGSLPPIISQFSKLESFAADASSFNGAILSSLVKIPSLTKIFLRYNQFNDFAGISNISLLPNLQTISIGSRNYNKVYDSEVNLNVFLPLKKLDWLSIYGIPLSTANITLDSDFPSSLEYLVLSGCNITKFPEFVRYERNLQKLDLSNNKIKGQVPDWLWRLPKLEHVSLSKNSLSGFNGSLKVYLESQNSFVDLSSNAFQGPLFIPSSKHLQYFSGSKNNFTGEIPQSICGVNSLEGLDLSNNNLHGSIPWCLETLVMTSLAYLNLRNNRLSGILPEIFHHAKSLMSLDVSHNRLEGKIPASLVGCSALEVLNVGSNTIKDMFPFHLNSLQKLQVLVLHSNRFHGTLRNADGVWFGFPHLKIIDVSHNDFSGTLPSDYFLNWTAMYSKRDNNMELEYIWGPSEAGYYSLVLMNKGVSMEMERILTTYTAIDFSGNQLHGPIPDSIGLLKELHILNMSSNAFTGHIPSTLTNLTNLESLDLSQNKISGEIPPELGTLSSLEVINVSHNQLVGSIPQGTQFQRQKCSSYEGNLGLNALSLKDVCGDIKAPTQSELVETKEEEEEEALSWMAAGLGFAPGVVFGLVMGHIVVLYKHEWFMKVFGRRKQRTIRAR